MPTGNGVTFMRGLAADVDAAEALAAAAGRGRYFVVEPWAEAAGWRQARLLVSDPVVLADRVTHARAVIAGRAGIVPAQVAEPVLSRPCSGSHRWCCGATSRPRWRAPPGCWPGASRTGRKPSAS